MAISQDAKEAAAAAYNAAADFYDHTTNSFWDRFGRRTIDRLRLTAGAKVLDVCCGSGASAIPAAEQVSPTGNVVGFDLSENLLKLARDKAGALGLANAEFRTGDMLDLRLPDSEFDAVVCVFGIFFVPDMPAALRELWRMVRPGGQLAITTWGPRLFEPANSFFWESIRDVRPDLHKTFNPWDRISEPESIQSLLSQSGMLEHDVVAEAGSHKIESPEDWWRMIMGSGYRGTVEHLTPTEREHIRERCVSSVSREGIRELQANVVYARATKAN